MFKLKLIIIPIILFLIVNIVNANEIGIVNNQYVEIRQWEETDVIEDRNLHVSLVADLFFDKDKVLKRADSIKFEFTPWEDADAGNLPITNLKFQVCQGSSHSHNYYDIPIKCDRVIPFTQSSTIRAPHYGYKYYFLNFSLSDIDFTDQPIYVKIDYTIPNFIEKGIDKFILIDTMCYPTEGCPTPTMIDKFVMLPKESAVNYFPPNSILIKWDGRLVIDLNDFTPYAPSHGQYERMAISYTDLKEERYSEIFNQVFWLFLGISIPLIISLLKWFVFDKKKRINED